MILSSKHTALLAGASVLESKASSLEGHAARTDLTALSRAAFMGRARILRERAAEVRRHVAKEATSHG